MNIRQYFDVEKPKRKVKEPAKKGTIDPKIVKAAVKKVSQSEYNHLKRNVEELQLRIAFFDKKIWEREEEFLEKFCHGAWSLIHTRYGEETFEFIYCTEEGQHMVDGIKYEELLEWIK